MSEERKAFRFRIIPATLSWVIGGLVIFGTPFAAYHAWRRFPIEFPESQPYRLSCYLAVARIPCVFIMGLLLIYAGKEWMRGKWPLAILPYAIIAVLIAILETLDELIWDRF